MTLITQAQTKSMDYGYYGEPFVVAVMNPSINLNNMDCGYYGEPFVVNSPSVAGNIKSFCGILRANLKNIGTTKSLAGIVD